MAPTFVSGPTFIHDPGPFCAARCEGLAGRFWALMRTVNDRIAALDKRATGWAAPEQRFEFLCECGKTTGCDGRVMMTLAEIERVRCQWDRFAVMPGHATDEIEWVVEQDERDVNDSAAVSGALSGPFVVRVRGQARHDAVRRVHRR